MTRYGWSLGREASSPYGSMTGFPEVGDDDFSYITSQDLDDPGMGYSDSRHFSRSRNNNNNSATADLEDDILLIKNKGVTYPAHFPAYSIGDGKLYVKDVRDRIALMMDLSSRSTKHIKLLYKGKQLKESTMPIRDYGVKNKSEIMAVIPEGDDESSVSGDEAGQQQASRGDAKSKSRRKKRVKRRSDRPDGDAAISPRESAPNLELPKSPTSSSAALSGPMKKLDELFTEYKTKWLPLCREYIRSPPKDPKKREEEHRRLGESVLQHVLLKADGVEADGNPDIRKRRKELVSQVTDLLKELDTAKAS